MNTRTILTAAALIAATTLGGTATAANQPHPKVNCIGSPQWATYPSTSPGCNVQAGQVLHVRYLPSTMTLAAAQTWCTDRGGDSVETLYLSTANVCKNIDF